jgi:hypothetical protein
MKAKKQTDEQRQRICQEAARIMAEEGVRDYHAAKRRAAGRLNWPQDKHLPSNQEIERALTDYLRLFQGRHLDERTRQLRRHALEAMRFLARFEPRLVGALLSGTVTTGSAVELHLTADTPEEVGFFLADHHIPHEQFSHRLRFGGDRVENTPAFRFAADGVAIELTVLTSTTVREAPLSPVDGRPMRRANTREVELLVQQSSATSALG